MTKPLTSPVEIKKPLTGWEKVKSGVKGFFKTALHYLPRGLMMAGAFLGGSYLLGLTSPGLDLFKAGQMNGIGEVATHIGKVMAIGGLITGGIGAWQTVKAETKQREAEIAAQGQELARARGRERTRLVESDPVEVPKNLPTVQAEALSIPTL